jgi:hypothetical protein
VEKARNIYLHFNTSSKRNHTKFQSRLDINLQKGVKAFANIFMNIQNFGISNISTKNSISLKLAIEWLTPSHPQGGMSSEYFTHTNWCVRITRAPKNNPGAAKVQRAHRSRNAKMINLGGRRVRDAKEINLFAQSDE